MKQKITLNERQLNQIVTESVKRVLKERYGVDDDSLEVTRIGNHKKRRGVKTKGNTETRDFLRQQTAKGNPIIKYKRNPKEWLDNLMSQSDEKSQLSETRLNRIVMESMKKVLRETYTNEDFKIGDIVNYSSKKHPFDEKDYDINELWKIVDKIGETMLEIESIETGEVTYVSCKDVVHNDENRYFDSLHLNQNIPDERGVFYDPDNVYTAWGKPNSHYYKYDADGNKVHAEDKEADYADKYGSRTLHNVDVPSKKQYIGDLHGEGNFLRNSRAASYYTNTGKAGHYNPWYGYNDYDGNAEQDLNDFNAAQNKRMTQSYKRALDAADKRPLHHKGSANRELMDMDN